MKTVGGSFQGAWVDAERFVLSPRLTFEENKPKVVLIGEDITDMRVDGYVMNYASEHLGED